MIGVHERIAFGIAEEIRQTIPCYVEGPEFPTDGWANVHIDGLGNESVTITIYNDRLILSKFGYALGSRKMRKDWAYGGRYHFHEKLLCNPDSIDWIVRHTLREILVDGSCLYNCFDKAEKIRRLNLKSVYTPTIMLLGKPDYI